MASLQKRYDALFQLYWYAGNRESSETSHRLCVRDICASEPTLQFQAVGANFVRPCKDSAEGVLILAPSEGDFPTPVDW
jgi:hypothetical protein